jgi:hypothetical protein
MKVNTIRDAVSAVGAKCVYIYAPEEYPFRGRSVPKSILDAEISEGLCGSWVYSRTKSRNEVSGICRPSVFRIVTDLMLVAADHFVILTASTPDRLRFDFPQSVAHVEQSAKCSFCWSVFSTKIHKPREIRAVVVQACGFDRHAKPSVFAATSTALTAFRNEIGKAPTAVGARCPHCFKTATAVEQEINNIDEKIARLHARKTELLNSFNKNKHFRGGGIGISKDSKRFFQMLATASAIKSHASSN